MKSISISLDSLTSIKLKIDIQNSQFFAAGPLVHGRIFAVNL
jgi:hypothetical protein